MKVKSFLGNNEQPSYPKYTAEKTEESVNTGGQRTHK